MSGVSSANNSWTILTPEETVAETLRPLAEEGTEHHEGSLTSAADEAGPGESRPAEGAEEAGSAEELPEERHHLLSEDKAAELSEDTGTEQQPPVPAVITEAPPLSSLEVSDSLVPGSDELSQSEGLPEGPAGACPDPDSFSDSYTHITPSPDEPPASLLSTETLGGGELIEEVERLVQEETLHSNLNGKELQYEGEESDLFPRTADLGKQADSPGDSEVGKERTEKTGEEPEPEVRRRRSLLAALERIGRAEEEEEEFQLPRQDDDSGFSVNKCILGALILLGLGTIFLSGVFMDLDEESDYGTMELKDAEVPGKQEWLNPEVPPLPVAADSTELLNKLDEGNQQISVLQAQLQAQGEELKVAKGQAAEGAKERLRREEAEEENSRLKKEMASLPVLQKENERMKRELESGPALQKELETLRSTVTELKLPTAAPVTLTTPPSSDSTQEAAGSTERKPTKPWEDQKETKKDVKKDTNEMGEKKEWKEKSEWKEGKKELKDGGKAEGKNELKDGGKAEGKKELKDGGKAEGKKELKDGGKAEGKNELKDGGKAEGKKELKDGGKAEGKKGKHEQGKFESEKDKEGKLKKASDETKQWKEKDLKKEKSGRGDEGKPWKDKAEKKEWKGKSEGKDWNKGKHEKVKEGKQWSGKEEKKDWKVGKDRGEKNKGKEEWKKGGKDGFKESGKGKWGKEDRGEKKEWVKKESDWRGKNSKGKGENKEWEERKHPERKGKEEKEWKRKDEKKQWEKKEEPWKREGEKDRKHNGDRKKDASSSQKHKSNGHKNHKEEPLWVDRKPPPTHSRPSLDQPEYWEQQRDRLQQNPKATQQCSSVETCAQAEGLLPVPLLQFEAILQTYLSRAEEAGVAASKTDELRKLAAKFFKEGFFVHEQTSFTEFVEDLEDILEDMVEGDEDAEEEHSDLEDSDLEDEMEEFVKEVIKKFAAPVVAVEKEGRAIGEGRKERGRG
ncbi:LOW QUALITY PROTEIN: pre-B-cell leukemia homeobox interacting protein 1b [Gymnodraco acuticeps]|uniref:LOW QUALITY PROTEIN: pre-B-cell leukemia homeobox interacting protein 1b n=1 Tax=Gymnodraco acuticeps TaxID=8218 RepID=A0A6P8W8L7_GYMAC|nr:LOW QUALITY PROTEIN: pre-B-cell leukemia homeobox interacting protein 1b [Gymnodraco acuticeps]